jgi:hypothetical protein
MARSDPDEPLEAFSKGAISTAHAHLLRKIEQLAGDYPVSVTHRRLVRQLGGEIVYASSMSGKFAGRWLCLVRFGDVLEGQFGLSAEIPLIYDHHTDLQIRTVDSIPEVLESLPSDRQSVSSEIILLWTADPGTDRKALEWSRPTRTIVPMPRSSDTKAEDLLGAIAQQLFARDFYVAHGSVYGTHFFGRRGLLASMQQSLDNGRVVGLFGMRKSGKTSLLKELIRNGRLGDKDTGKTRVFVYQDLEHLSDFTGDPVAELLKDIRESVWEELKSRGMRTKELADLPQNASLHEFRAALNALLHRLDAGEGVVLMLDEIEHLCHPNAERQEGTPAMKKVPQLFGVLRKVAEERENFSLVVAGLASASVEASQLYGRPNPFFALADTHYLGPLNDKEGASLLRDLGERVGLRWKDPAVELAMAESGGNAMLLRLIGSQVLSQLPQVRTKVAVIDRDDVVAVLQSWRLSVSAKLREIVLNLGLFYPEETQLLEVLMSSSDEFVEMAYLFPDKVNRLEQIGVIHRVGQQWVPSRILQMGWELASPSSDASSGQVSKETTSPTGYSQVAELSLSDLIAKGENESIEFKQTATYDVDKGTKNKDIELAVAKTVAGFLNAHGGVLVIGVNDSGQVVGIAPDISVAHTKKDEDGYELWLTGLLNHHLGRVTVVRKAAVSFDSEDSERVCKIDVMPGDEPTFIGSEGVFYVRIGNSTQPFNPKDANAYIQKHWPTG